LVNGTGFKPAEVEPTPLPQVILSLNQL